MIHVRSDVTNELITVADGYRVIAASWKIVLEDLKRRR